MNNNNKYIIGVDFGSDSCRAVVIDAYGGEIISSATKKYTRWSKGLYCDPEISMYRQHPLDYVESLVGSIRDALKALSKEQTENIISIGLCTTGSTPCLINKDGVPLALLPEYKENPNAMFVLWKDHTAIEEANEINIASKQEVCDYTCFSGGVYSAEWFWAKALKILRSDSSIIKDAYSIIEHSDWMPAFLTGQSSPSCLKRNRCAAGHKGMWSHEWDGYPPLSFFTKVDPLYAHVYNDFSNKTYTADKAVGFLTAEWADRLALPEGIIVSNGILDAHAGAIGAGIEKNSIVKIIGTSTCDIIVVPENDTKQISGVSGQVDGSVIPGLIGVEAGQSAFGDIFAWYRDILYWSIDKYVLDSDMKKNIYESILNDLTAEVERTPNENDRLICNDWFNGRRTPYANQNLKATITGLSLGTTTSDLFKNLVESTCFGSKVIFNHLKENGLSLDKIICVGGISQKSPFIMQTLANVLNKEVIVSSSSQASAIGAAICASVAVGLYKNIPEAQAKILSGDSISYNPQKNNILYYEEKYNQYVKLNNLYENGFA